MSVIDKLLRWDELRVKLKAADEAGMELARENGNLRVENILLQREIEQLTKSNQELIDLAHNAWSMALCAMQGVPIPAEWGDAVERGLHKYGIDVNGECEVMD